MVVAPALYLLDGRDRRELCLQLHRELRLTARALQEQHEIACDFQRERTAVILLEQAECEVDSRRDAGRAVEIAITARRWNASRGIQVILDLAQRKVLLAAPKTARPARSSRS